MRGFRFLGCVVVAVAMVVVGCESPEVVESAPEDVVTSTGDPPMEGTGPEDPGDAVDGVAVTLPGVPVGGGVDDNSQVEQCVTASWLGDDDIPDGVSVAVTDVRIVPGGVFDLNGSSCGGVDGCADSFAFTAERDTCSAAVTATATEEREADLVMSGEARCSDQDADKCQDLASSASEQTISLTQPYEETDEDTDEDTGGEETPPAETMTESTG